jgi:O-antigen/teichoic acid export membrane protein
MKSLKKLITSDNCLVLIDQAIYSGTNFLLTLFIAKNLKISEFGIYSTLMLFTFLALSLTHALIIEPFQVNVMKLKKRKKYFVFLTLSIVVCLIAFLLLSIIPTLLIKTYNYSIFECSFFIATYIFQDFFRKLLLGINKIKIVIAIDFFFVILLIIWFSNAFEVLNLRITILIIALANLISATIGMVFIATNYAFPKKWKLYLKAHVNHGRWTVGIAILQWGSSNFFVLISGIYIGIEALGALRLVQSIFGILNIFLQTIENYFLPKIATLYHDNKQLAKDYLFKISTQGALIFGVILSLLFLFSSKIIVISGGYKYEKYSYLIQFMCVLYFVIFLSYPVRIMIRIQLLNKIFFYGYLFSFLFSIISFHFLLRHFNLSGAILGLITNQLIMILYWKNQLKKNSF